MRGERAGEGARHRGRDDGGADSIDDLDLLRHGAMPVLFGGVRAPSTLGSFLRSFTWGNVLQLGKVNRLLLRNSVDGLTAETLTGRIVQLTRNECPSTVQLALLEEIRSAESEDDRFAKVIMAVEGRGKLAWRHESVDTLIDLILQHQGEDG